jgi:hypothetical protein
MIARPAAPSAEMALLFACARPGEPAGHTAIDAPERGFDWPRFYDLAAVHGVRSAVLDRLAGQPGVAPDEVMKRLREYHAYRTILDRSLSDETVRLSGVLERAGVATVVLKGAAVRHSLYAAEPGLRHASDIDLFVDSSLIDSAEQLLRQEGYARRHPGFDPPARSKDVVNFLLHARGYAQRGTGHTVDLHHRLTANPGWMTVSFGEVLAGAVSVAAPAGEIRGLGPALLAQYLACHAVGHGFLRLSWLVDVARSLAALDSFEALAVTEQSHRVGALWPTLFSARLVERYFAIGSPLVYDAAEVDRRFARHFAFVDRQMARIRPPLHRRSLSGLRTELSYFRFYRRLGDSSAARRYSLAWLLTDARDTRMLRLGRGWLWAYYLAGPVLALGRFARRRGRDLLSASGVARAGGSHG